MACLTAIARGGTPLANSSLIATTTVALWRLYGITEEERLKGTEGSKVERGEPCGGCLHLGVSLCRRIWRFLTETYTRWTDSAPRYRRWRWRATAFLAVGSDTEMRALLSPGGREVNLGGATVVPGFIDAHIHFLSYGLSLKEIDLSGAPTLSSALERVGERVVDTPAGQWLTGRGWDQSVWEGGVFPAAAQLDEVAAEHPVFLARKCGHAAWVNSRALERVGITADTGDPDGGEIVRDGEGKADRHSVGKGDGIGLPLHG